MHKFFMLLCLFTTTLFAQQNSLTPDQALQRLTQGNLRFMHDQSTCSDRNKERRAALTSIQEPFAIIVGCSDSRLTPEIVFDQGVGDLFVVRVAGNVIGSIELESIEFAAANLHSSIVIVMGHENCGAVNAVLQGNSQDIEDIARLIQPAVQEVKNKPGNALENAIKANAARFVAQLKKNSNISNLIKQNKIKVVGGYYHLESGQVELLPE